MRKPNPDTNSPQSAAIYCRACGYALVGLPNHCCPECGRAFDLNDATTFETDHQRDRRKDRAATIMVLLLPVPVYLVCWVIEFVRIYFDTTADPSSGVSPSQWGMTWQLIESALDAMSTACMVAPVVVVISLILFWKKMKRT